ncbi:unnamed protein product [Paramecium primaurelia]|uniref:Transmembrane protein n=1 Tax=Paramecium primaurelia TaxID=5886 RepID=A0A8S1PEH2_PARPR|nr:unnamed protein product [Paramecium primaurelia]
MKIVQIKIKILLMDVFQEDMIVFKVLVIVLEVFVLSVRKDGYQIFYYKFANLFVVIKQLQILNNMLIGIIQNMMVFLIANFLVSNVNLVNVWNANQYTIQLIINVK